MLQTIKSNRGAVSLLLLAVLNSIVISPSANAGEVWTSRTSATDNDWFGVTYGNGLWVAVAATGTNNRVMTSPDGITWTSRTPAAENAWRQVVYAGGQFVAVANTGTGNRVMTSPDGITWTIRTSAADHSWVGLAYGNGLFVAVTNTVTGNQVMTSPDGITWTLRASAVSLQWRSVVYGNGVWVAVASLASSGTNNRVMTSTDGFTWTSRTSASNNNWRGVTYGNGLFVAVANTGTGNRVMTSPDGITWTPRTVAVDIGWTSVTHGNGLFVAVASTNGSTGTGNRVMTSPDGITWTIGTTVTTAATVTNKALTSNVATLTTSAAHGITVGMSAVVTGVGEPFDGTYTVTGVPTPTTFTYAKTADNVASTGATGTVTADNDWSSVAYGNGLFAAVSATGTNNRVMTGISLAAQQAAAALAAQQAAAAAEAAQQAAAALAAQQAAAALAAQQAAAAAEAAQQAAQQAAAAAAAAEAARIAAEIRAAEVAKAKSELKNILQSGGEPSLDTFKTAGIEGITQKNIEKLTKKILTLPTEQRSNPVAIEKMITIVTFFNLETPPLIADFVSRGIGTVTDRTLSNVAKELLTVPESAQGDITVIKQIVQRVIIVDKLSTPATSKSVQVYDLVAINALSNSNSKKVTITNALKKLDPNRVDTYQEVLAEIAKQEAIIKARAEKSAAIKAKQAARSSKSAP